MFYKFYMILDFSLKYVWLLCKGEDFIIVEETCIPIKRRGKNIYTVGSVEKLHMYVCIYLRVCK